MVSSYLVMFEQVKENRRKKKDAEITVKGKEKKVTWILRSNVPTSNEGDGGDPLILAQITITNIQATQTQTSQPCYLLTVVVCVYGPANQNFLLKLPKYVY